MTSVPLSCTGALALELVHGSEATRTALDAADAATLAGHIAHDLAALVPGVIQLDLGVLAAHFDPVELLRPCWPLHTALAELMTRAPQKTSPPLLAGEGEEGCPRAIGSQPDERPSAVREGRNGGEGRIIAFGTHNRQLAATELTPDVDYAHGPLRLIPFLLRGNADVIAPVAEALEEILVDRGMAGAATALFAQQVFDARIEHARYLTTHDLCALMALQYEHAGLASLWPLLECALLAPDEEAWLDAAPEPLLRYADGGVRIAMFDIDAWSDAGLAPVGIDPEQLSRAFDHFTARQRQFAAVLAAHDVPVTFDHCPAGKDPRKTLST